MQPIVNCLGSTSGPVPFCAQIQRKFSHVVSQIVKTTTIVIGEGDYMT